MDMKKKIAIMYDFDGTLAPVNMQEYSFIPEVKMQPRDFWEECAKIGEQANMDSNLAYMYFMTQKAKETGINITKESFYKHGKDITYFNGVETWFKRINEYAASLGLEVEHYIISCGNTEILKGCSIAHEFKRMFACSFHYDDKNIPIWPAQVVNYTTKTQYIYRVRKGLLDNLYDSNELNDYVENRETLLPHENMIYIGDGLTDVPSMKLVKNQGGHSIAVYNPTSEKKYDAAKQLYADKRVNFIAPADYSENSRIENIIKDILRKIVSNNKLDEYKDA